MKTGMAVAAGLILLAANAGATDIAGKWGIGAAFLNSGFETSLIHGHSERTAWTLSLRFSGRSADPSLEAALGNPPLPTTARKFNTDTWQIGARPSLRRFTRPTSEFSPYGDVFAFFGHGRFHSGGGGVTRTDKNSTVSTGLAFGLEYFTHRHASVAVETDVTTLGWNRLTEGTTGPGVNGASTENAFFVDARLSPRLVLRAYF